MFSPSPRSTSSSDREDDTSSFLSITPSDLDLLPPDSNRRTSSSTQSSHEVSQYLTPKGNNTSGNMSEDVPPQQRVPPRAPRSIPIVTNRFVTAANPPDFQGFSHGMIQNHFHGSAMSMTLNLNKPGNYSVDLRTDVRFPNNGANVAANASPHRFNNGPNGQP